MTFWQYGALMSAWNLRHDHDGVSPPTADEYYQRREELIAMNDPQIRLH